MDTDSHSPFTMTASAPALATALTAQNVPGSPRIAFVAKGQGEGVIFLHGIGGNHHSWDEQLQHFSSHYQAIAWDARGYLDSQDYEGPCRFEDFSDDLRRLMDHLRLDKAHLVGLSMGGRILMDFATRHPQRVQTLVLAASFPSFGQTLSAQQQDDFMRLRRQPLEEGKSLVDMAPALVDALLGPHASAQVRAQMLASIASLRPQSYLKTLQATLAFDRRRELAQIQAPTLLIYGEHDRVVTPAQGRDVWAAMPHARYVTAPGVGHLINLEAPEFFNAQVQRFIGEHPIR